MLSESENTILTSNRSSTIDAARDWFERHPLLLPAVILLVGAIFRFYNLNWDSGNQLHPDEREIYMVISGANGNVPLSLPTSWSSFLSVKDPIGGSPLNPHFFSYGSMPFYVLGAIAATIAFIGQHVPGFSSWAAADTYGNLPYIGRSLSALLDLLSVALIFLLGRRLWSYWTGVLAMAMVAFTVLDIQLAHFFAVDTVLLPLSLLTLLGATEIVRRGSTRTYVWTGMVLGAALATKTTALLLIIPLGTAAVLAAWASVPWERRGTLWDDLQRHYWNIAAKLNFHLQWTLAALVIAALAFVICEPYAVLDRAQLLHDINDQTNFLVTNSPPFAVPFTIQYAHTVPYLYQFQNLVFWCLGIPLGIASFAGVLFYLVRAARLRIRAEHLVLLLWVVVYFLFVGRFFAKFNRYMLPITPVMALLGAAGLMWLATRATRWARAVGWASIAIVLLVSFGYSMAYMNVYAHTNTRVAASEWIYKHIPAGTRLGNEGAWDDALPLNVGTLSGAQYPNAIGLDLYNGECDDAGVCNPADVEAKIRKITDVLQHTQYLVMSSERMVRSIPKLPQRYPVTIRYYNLLFQGKLNFRLVRVFQQHPQLGPIVVHDYPADESFHVYDHPIVRIFKRVAPISAARVMSLLAPGGINAVSGSGRQLPVNPTPDARLMLSASKWAKDQTGPTYAQMFPPAGFAMQHPILVWWLLLELLGLIAFPLVFVVFAGLADRGFIIAKTIGLMILGWVVWISVSLGLTTYDRGLLYVVTVLLLVMSAALGYRLKDKLLAFMRQHWRRLLTVELVFLAAFAIGIFLRMWYPDLGHQFSPPGPATPTGGRMGEKQMELAFLNAIVRSRVFPPFDPFFAHGYINYYYYGFFLVGTLCKLAQIAPSTGFNLAIATFFALLLATAYSIVSTLTRRIAPGVFAAIFVGIIGNLAAAWQLIQGLMSVGSVHSSFPFIGGCWDVISGLRAVIIDHQPLPAIDFWAPTRIVPPVGQGITEFPYFTYLFADLHPHLIAYPMTAAAIAFSVCLARSRDRGLSWEAALVVGSLVLGGIAATNPWDFPTYLGVAGVGALMGSYYALRRLHAKLLLRPVLWMFGLGTLSSLAYLPFKLNYQTVFTTGLGLTRDITPDLLGPDISASDAHDILVTPLRVYLEHFGLFLFVIVSYLLLLLFRDAGLRRMVVRSGLLLQFVFYYRDRWPMVRRAARVARRMVPPRPPVVDPSLLVGFVIMVVGLCLLRYFLLAFLVGMLALAILLLVRLAHRLSHWELFACVLLFVPIALSIGTQIFFIKDFLAGGADFRMNTVFKFYDQAWLMYALCAAVMLYALMDRLVGHGGSSRNLGEPVISPGGTKVLGRRAPLTTASFTPAAAVSTGPGQVALAGAANPTLPVGALSQSRLVETEEPGVDVGEEPGENEIEPSMPPSSGRRRSMKMASQMRRPLALLERYPVWTLAFAVLLASSLVYTYGGTINRETYRTTWLPETSVPYTLDGMAFMKVAYPQDYAGINWLNSNVRGAQVLAEAHAPSYGYTWPSRVSMFTGLPTIINGIHEGEQRYGDEMNPADLCNSTRDPASCQARLPSRDDDLKTLYDSPSTADAWRVIHKYDVRYIFVGFSERHCIQDVCYSHAGIQKFNRMVGHGLKLAFHAPGVSIYEVGG